MQKNSITSEFRKGILPLLEASPEPLDPEFIGELAIAYLRRNMFDVSETLMARAPEAAHTIVSNALAARARRKLDAVGLLEYFDAALEELPGAHEVRVRRAQTRLALQQHELALEDANIALQHQPDDPRATEVRAVALMGLGRFDEAQAALARLHPSEYSARRPTLWMLASQLALILGDPLTALPDLKRYVEANPQETYGWAQLASAYEQAEQPDNARWARRNCGRVFYHGGVEALEEGDGAKAADLFGRAVEFAPDYEPARQAMEQSRPAMDAREEGTGG
ncbi:MAG: tetratricopeptide repeat protein [Deltaproteobacteria bacterium]|nr:tetratricopeptide repeat protein [Deltaproteobacteria bacterium]